MSSKYCANTAHHRFAVEHQGGTIGARTLPVVFLLTALCVTICTSTAHALPPALNAARADAFLERSEPPAASEAAPTAPPVAQLPAEYGETLDRYAERVLQHRLHAPAPDPVDAAQTSHDPAGQVGAMGPANLDLIYVAGTGARSQAYIRIDNKYAKRMGVGEFVAGWHLKAIGVDHVDIVKDDEQARLYLFSSRFELKSINQGHDGVF